MRDQDNKIISQIVKIPKNFDSQLMGGCSTNVNKWSNIICSSSPPMLSPISSSVKSLSNAERESRSDIWLLSSGLLLAYRLGTQCDLHGLRCFATSRNEQRPTSKLHLSRSIVSKKQLMNEEEGRESLTYDNSVLWVPPEEHWPSFLRIKSAHMNPRVQGQPFPHITMSPFPPPHLFLHTFIHRRLSPFVEDVLLYEAELKIKEVLSKVEPFKISFRNFHVFSNRSSHTLYLEPESQVCFT